MIWKYSYSYDLFTYFFAFLSDFLNVSDSSMALMYFMVKTTLSQVFSSKIILVLHVCVLTALS